ncbi:MAG: DUF3857 domain-containing protein [Bacteroidales bacterium]|nr:DUF3857 domain-containing protein [Bacteroidales bacterium]
MKRKYYNLLLISTFLTSNLSFAQDDNSDAIFLKLEKEYQLNEDGSSDFRLSKELKLLTYYSFHRLYGETFIVYNPEYQKLKINESYTIMADGKKIQTPDNAFNELLPRFASDAPDHNYLREMAITHTGLEKNAVINLDYSLHSEKDFLNIFKISDYLAESSPVDELIIKVKIPLSAMAKFKLLNSEVLPEIKEEGNMRVYIWTFNNLPAYSGEFLQAGWETFSPVLLFSTANNIHDYISSILKQPAFEYNVNDRMRKKAESLKTDSSDELDLALKIQKYVVKEFKLKNIPSSKTGYKYRQANEVWESSYATSAEKLILLTALLTTVNLDAIPYAVIPANLYNEEISNAVIKDYLVRVNTKDGSYFYLSNEKINDQDMAYELSDMALVPMSFNEDKKIVFERKRKNEINVKGELKLGKDGHINGIINAKMAYASNPFFDLKRNKSKAQQLISGGISSSDYKSKILASEPEKSTIEYTVASKEALSKKANYMFFELPYLKNGIEELHIHGLSGKRSFPLKLPYAFSENYEYKIKLDEGMSLVNSKIKREEKNKVGKVVIEIKSSVVKRSIFIYQSFISVDDYPAFRKLMNLWNDRNYREIVVVSDQ